METYEYRCVAGPSRIAVKTDNDREAAVKSYEDIINTEAAQGWQYVGIDEFQTQNPTGCLGMGGPEIATLKMLVFRKRTS